MRFPRIGAFVLGGSCLLEGLWSITWLRNQVMSVFMPFS